MNHLDSYNLLETCSTTQGVCVRALEGVSGAVGRRKIPAVLLFVVHMSSDVGAQMRLPIHAQHAQRAEYLDDGIELEGLGRHQLEGLCVSSVGAPGP